MNVEARLLIDGELVAASGERTYANINPATEDEIGRAPDASAEDMERAIAAARSAFDESEWSRDLAFRAHCLRQLQTALEKHREDLREKIVAEVGTPIQLTYAVQLDSCIQDMAWDIECAEKYEWEHELGEHKFFGIKSQRRVRREAVGVAGLVTPWNFPFMLNLAKLVPALMAGCTVVLKAAPDTPWSACMIGRLVAEETDIPAGVFNVITAESPAEVGDVLTGDPRVDLVSFTGSTEVGKHIMRRCADGLKRVFLELGGKSAQILLDDADFGSLAFSGMSVCIHAGQGCAISTRLLLPRSRYDEGVEHLKASFEGVAYGDPTDVKNSMGPLINARQRDRVLGYIETGRKEGGRVLVGGGRPAHLSRGWFVEPTLIVDVDPDATVAQEEIFGPVLAVIPYDDDDDAIRIANNSRYGLSGGVTSASLERAMAVAERVRTGTMMVNGGMWYAPDSPFGGYKQSGLGREHGVAGFEEYLETKTIGYPAAPSE
jgi:aldehyde dehydrogenase (NAD+)